MLDTREAAFLYAVVGSSALHAVAEGCSQGRLVSCVCENSPRRRTQPLPVDRSTLPGSVSDNGTSSSVQQEWTWRGCMGSVVFSYTKSKQFMDVNQKDLKTMIQAHNYEAGRLVSLLIHFHHHHHHVYCIEIMNNH